MTGGEPARGEDRRVLTDREARILLDPRRRRLLEPFAGRARSLAPVARELDVRLSVLLYHVRHFVDAGLLVVVREERRAGRATKFYRTSADAFSIPLSQSGAADAVEYLRLTYQDLQLTLDERLAAEWVAARSHETDWALEVATAAPGRFYRMFVPRAGAVDTTFFEELLGDARPALWNAWPELQLARPDAKALQRELSDLIRRYSARQTPGEDRFLLHLAMARLAPGD